MPLRHKVFGWSGCAETHVQWATQCRGNSQKTFLSYVSGQQFSVKWLGATFESSSQAKKVKMVL